MRGKAASTKKLVSVRGRDFHNYVQQDKIAAFRLSFYEESGARVELKLASCDLDD